MLELLVTRPEVNVAESEYRRLLGYPRQHSPSARAQELSAWARQWYAQHGRPWIYVREAALEFSANGLRIDGIEFPSAELRGHLQRFEAQRVVLMAVSAGRNCEDYAQELWQESKPDEYFFLEILASTVVEHLVASVNGRVCAQAEAGGFVAAPHYSPGYNGWDVADQNILFSLIRSHGTPWPEPVEVLPSGMLRPKKALLGVIGLAPQTPARRFAVPAVPCSSCSFSPCQFRRAPYHHAAGGGHRTAEADAAIAVEAAAPKPAARYTVNPRALDKWSRERVRFEPTPSGAVAASFRFDGTTCSNLGRPLAFEYRILLQPPVNDAGSSSAENRVDPDAYIVASAECRPADGDDGYRSMCEYLRDPVALMAAIADEKPLLGQPLRDVLYWQRQVAPTGCYCDRDSRTHKWGLAFEAIHYALTHGAKANAPAANRS